MAKQRLTKRQNCIIDELWGRKFRTREELGQAFKDAVKVCKRQKK
ncbi:hypothetical protein ES705_22255 [subsurface metagenome]